MKTAQAKLRDSLPRARSTSECTKYGLNSNSGLEHRSFYFKQANLSSSFLNEYFVTVHLDHAKRSPILPLN